MTPTVLPIGAFASTEFKSVSISVNWPTGPVTETVSVSVNTLPSEDVALTVNDWLVPASPSNVIALLNSPVLTLILKRPFALSTKPYTTLSLISSSVARAVNPTAVPTPAVDETVFIAGSVSIGSVTLCSLTSVTFMIIGAGLDTLVPSDTLTINTCC